MPHPLEAFDEPQVGQHSSSSKMQLLCPKIVGLKDTHSFHQFSGVYLFFLAGENQWSQQPGPQDRSGRVVRALKNPP